MFPHIVNGGNSDDGFLIHETVSLIQDAAGKRAIIKTIINSNIVFTQL
jgi:hypothetical protein